VDEEAEKKDKKKKTVSSKCLKQQCCSNIHYNTGECSDVPGKHGSLHPST
jgi:hypothetical protein